MDLLQAYGAVLTLLLLCGGYIVLLMVAKCAWIYRRNQMHLHAYADMIEAQLTAEQDKPEKTNKTESAVIPEIKALLAQARAQVPLEGHSSCWSFTVVGRQLAAWRLVHDADRIATDLWPEAHVTAYAVVASEELKSIATSTSTALAAKIGEFLKSHKNEPTLRALVKEARGLIFGARDCYYEDLSDWQNKATWLVFVTTAILFILSAVMGNDKLLLLGAVGGLLARLRKTLASKSVGFDYGVSWSVLFLAPLVGALTGWAGVLLSVVFISPELLMLGSQVQLTWQTAASTEPGMVLALIFGFSATLFDRVMERAESALAKKPAGGGASTRRSDSEQSH